MHSALIDFVLQSVIREVTAIMADDKFSLPEGIVASDQILQPGSLGNENNLLALVCHTICRPFRLSNKSGVMFSVPILPGFVASWWKAWAMIFSGSITENIHWGKPDASQEEIEKATEIAQMHDYVSSLPEKYNTHLSQGAVNLSGGQKQRISIARAVIKEADILVMDDSSSALDFATDLRLRQAIKNEMSDRTIVIIAQRISTVMNADRILVLNKGKVVGFGSHDELLAGCDIYQEIYESQIGGGVING